MQHRLVTIGTHEGQLSPTLVAAVAAGWGCLGFASFSGLGTWFSHGHLLQSGLPIQVVLSSFVGGWLVMLIAMMLPTLPRQARVSTGFVLGYLLVWIAFGLAALVFDAGIHWTVNHSSLLRLHAWVIQVALLAAAGVYQLTRVKRQFLTRCLAPVAGSGIVQGWQAGGLSVGCCWALMLTAFAAGMTQLGWMVGLTLAMVVEKDSQWPDSASRLVGMVLLSLAAGLAVASFWSFPTLFAS